MRACTLRCAAAALLVGMGASATSASADPRAADGYYHDIGRQAAKRHHPQWALRVTHARAAWQVTRGAGVQVAIVDSGIGPTWELDGRVTAAVNLAGGRPPARVDTQDHGTAVACIIAARPDVAGRRGITGVAPGAQLRSARIFDGFFAPQRRVIAGIRWAVRQRVDVLNLSLTARDTPALRAATARALRRGVIVVAGAGNTGDSGDRPQYPAAYPGVIAVGGVTATLDHHAVSTTGRYVDVVAPSANVLSCDPFATLSRYSGTSFAAPMVSGVVALMKAANPHLTAERAQRILRATARDLGAPGRDPVFGYGLVDADRAVRAAAQ